MDVNNNKLVGTLLRMSGSGAFPVAPFLNDKSVKTLWSKQVRTLCLAYKKTVKVFGSVTYIP